MVEDMFGPEEIRHMIEQAKLHWNLADSVNKMREKQKIEFLETVFEFGNRWHESRGLHPIMVGDHLTREDCITFVRGECCDPHRKNVDSEFECWMAHHYQSCNLDPYESCSFHLEVMFRLLEKGSEYLV